MRHLENLCPDSKTEFIPNLKDQVLGKKKTAVQWIRWLVHVGIKPLPCLFACLSVSHHLQQLPSRQEHKKNALDHWLLLLNRETSSFVFSKFQNL